MENEELQEVLPEETEQVDLVLEEETPTEQPAQEIDWKAEALKQKAIAQRLAKKVSTQPVEKKQDLPTEDFDVKKTVKELQLAEKKRQFGYEHGLSPEEADAVFKINPNPTKDVLEDPFVKGGLSAIRAKKKVEDNIPKSSRSASFQLPKKEGVTAEDKQKAFEEYLKEKLTK
jgi:hypothetical protein